MSKNLQVLKLKQRPSIGCAPSNAGFESDMYCFQPIRIEFTELGITAVDRLFPLKPKNPI
jgi:hypothetical protein